MSMYAILFDKTDVGQHAPAIDGFGAVGDGAHQTDEYVDLDALADRVGLLAPCLLDDQPQMLNSES
jgi:glutamate carboxypeptidase